jgi:hypothetical protein
MAARLLMRFAAAEIENYGNNATGIFKQLFQFELSGTEVAPWERFPILDEGIDSGDIEIVRVCLQATDACLGGMSLSRMVGAEEIGTQPPLQDWNSDSHDDLDRFVQRALAILAKIGTEYPVLAGECDSILAKSFRMLTRESLLDTLTQLMLAAAERHNPWHEGLAAIGHWLYFDRSGFPESLQVRVRALYDRLLPKTPVGLAVFYTRLWPTDITDPDAQYDQEAGGHEAFEYSTQKAREQANVIANDPALLEEALAQMPSFDLKNVVPFADELAAAVADPLSTFRTALASMEAGTAGRPPETGFIRGLLRGIDRRDPVMANDCVALALSSELLQDRAVELVTVVTLSKERLAEITQSVRAGALAPRHCVYLSYGQAMAHLPTDDVLLLLDELAVNHGTEGEWAVLEIVSMLQHGKSDWDRALLTLTTRLLTSPRLFTDDVTVKREGYAAETLIRTLPPATLQDDHFAALLSAQIVNACSLAGTSNTLVARNPLRIAAETLVTYKPLVLWQTISKFVERATAAELRRLNQLIGRRGGVAIQNGEVTRHSSILFAIPETVRLEWADSDPSTRAPFLVTLPPIFSENSERKRVWHPEIETQARRYGTHAAFRHALWDQFQVRSWSGSLIPLLELNLEPLESWYEHPVAQIAEWSRQAVRQLKIQITHQERREEEWP